MKNYEQGLAAASTLTSTVADQVLYHQAGTTTNKVLGAPSSEEHTNHLDEHVSSIISSDAVSEFFGQELLGSFTSFTETYYAGSARILVFLDNVCSGLSSWFIATVNFVFSDLLLEILFFVLNTLEPGFLAGETWVTTNAVSPVWEGSFHVREWCCGYDENDFSSHLGSSTGRESLSTEALSRRLSTTLDTVATGIASLTLGLEAVFLRFCLFASGVTVAFLGKIGEVVVVVVLWFDSFGAGGGRQADVTSVASVQPGRLQAATGPPAATMVQQAGGEAGTYIASLYNGNVSWNIKAALQTMLARNYTILRIRYAPGLPKWEKVTAFLHDCLELLLHPADPVWVLFLVSCILILVFLAFLQAAVGRRGRKSEAQKVFLLSSEVEELRIIGKRVFISATEKQEEEPMLNQEDEARRSTEEIIKSAQLEDADATVAPLEVLSPFSKRRGLSAVVAAGHRMLEKCETYCRIKIETSCGGSSSRENIKTETSIRLPANKSGSGFDSSTASSTSLAGNKGYDVGKEDMEDRERRGVLLGDEAARETTRQQLHGGTAGVGEDPYKGSCVHQVGADIIIVERAPRPTSRGGGTAETDLTKELPVEDEQRGSCSPGDQVLLHVGSRRTTDGTRTEKSAIRGTSPVEGVARRGKMAQSGSIAAAGQLPEDKAKTIRKREHNSCYKLFCCCFQQENKGKLSVGDTQTR
ncbi:unnamed protein product [Amoebophrya sp. A120]|nr:unnamed protein product [Amoebophrya sp. A120]|eukprot:GSA120T00009837001.1